MDELGYVIISYNCNFWGMASLEALLESLDDAGVRSTVYLVHNDKTQAQIDHFQGYFRGVGGASEVVHVRAYEGLFVGVPSCFDVVRQPTRGLLASHPVVLNWLIKYHLPAGRYLFIDHDCIVHREFVRDLGQAARTLRDKWLGLPDHEGEYSSLTAPMFYCDTSIRSRLAGLCDTAWHSHIVGHDRHRLPGGGWPRETDTALERRIAKPNFDDTLYNVIRYLLANWPELESKIELVRWRSLDHIGHGGTARLDGEQLAILRRLLRGRLKPEFFACDRQSSVFAGFAGRLAGTSLIADLARM